MVTLYICNRYLGYMLQENWTPLYYATKYGQATVVEALLKSASVEMIVSMSVSILDETKAASSIIIFNDFYT